MPEIAGFTPEEGRIIWGTIQTLQKMGFVLKAGTKQPPLPPAHVPIYVKNVSGTTVPAFACMQATGTVEFGNQNYVEVSQPSDGDGTAGWFLFNGDREIGTSSSDQFGVAFAGPLVRVKALTTSPTAGDVYAPQMGSWSVDVDSGGFLVASGDDDIASGVIRAFLKGGGSNASTVVQTVVTDIRVDGNNLQYKTRDLNVDPDADETAWTTWHSGSTCE